MTPHCRSGARTRCCRDHQGSCIDVRWMRWMQNHMGKVEACRRDWKTKTRRSGADDVRRRTTRRTRREWRRRRRRLWN